MMAERALTDTAWYKSAIDDPKAFLPTYHGFLSRARIREGENIMTSQKRAELEGRAVAFLKAAQHRLTSSGMGQPGRALATS